MGREASGAVENPRGYSQVRGGGVESPQGIDTPGVVEFPQGDETSGVTTKGEGVPGNDGRGRGGDRIPPTTRATEARRAGGRDEERMGRPRMAPLLCPQRGTEADTDSAGPLLRHTVSTNGARPEHCMLARHEYGLLALMGAAIGPADAGYQGSGDGHEATRRTADQAWRETQEGGGTRKRALPARGMQRVNEEGRRPPGRSCMFNACGCQGGERGGDPPPSSARPQRTARDRGGTPKHGIAPP